MTTFSTLGVVDIVWFNLSLMGVQEAVRLNTVKVGICSRKSNRGREVGAAWLLASLVLAAASPAARMNNTGVA